MMRDVMVEATQEEEGEERKLVEKLRQELGRGLVPPLLIDPMTQDILNDPVIAEDGVLYSRESISNWIRLSTGDYLYSPVTGEIIGENLSSCSKLSRILDLVACDCYSFRKIRSIDDSFPVQNNTEESQHKEKARPLLSLCRLAMIYEQVDNYLTASLAEKHPNWRVPQLAVLGLIGVGKSSLLERLLMISAFPMRNRSGRGNGDCGNEDKAFGTYVPLHVKLRHVHRDVASMLPSVVVRVIDTNKKVQIGDAKIFACFDNIHLKLDSLMRQLRKQEIVAASSKAKLKHLTSAEGFDKGYAELPSDCSSIRADDVALSRAIVVHIYSPAVPTLNIVDLPGLLPEVGPGSGAGTESNTKELKKLHDRRFSLKRGESGGYDNSSAGSRRNSVNSGIASISSNTASFLQDSDQPRESFSQRQTWNSDTSRERRVEIMERYILSYPDSLYLLVTSCTSKQQKNDSPLDTSLAELIQYYELENRTIGVLLHPSDSEQCCCNDESVLHEMDEALTLPLGFTSLCIPPERHLDDNNTPMMKLNCHLQKYICLSTRSYNWRYGAIVNSSRMNFFLSILLPKIFQAYIDDLKLTWIPLSLLELFNEKEKIAMLNEDLGLPFAPTHPLHLPPSLFQAGKLQALKASVSELDVPGSTREFLVALLEVICFCITAEKYDAKICLLGTTVLNPFVSAINDLHKAHFGNCLAISNCLNPETSIDRAISGLKNEISSICEQCIARMKLFWSDAIRDILFEDTSYFKIQRFPQLIQYLQEYVRQSLERCLFQDLPAKWHLAIDTFFAESSRDSLTRLAYSFTSTESTCSLLWEGERLSSSLMSKLISRDHLASRELLQRELLNGVGMFFNDQDKTCQVLEEHHHEQRKELILLDKAVNKSIHGLLLHLRPSSLMENPLSTFTDQEDLSLKDAGNIASLKKISFTPRHLRMGGFTAKDALGAGYTVRELRSGGYSLPEGAYGGFSLSEFRDCSDHSALLDVINTLVAEGADLLHLVTSGFRLHELSEAGIDLLSHLSIENFGIEEIAVAAKAVGAAVKDELLAEDDFQKLIVDGTIKALLQLLDVDNHLEETLVTQVKCAAADTISIICQIASTLDDDDDGDDATGAVSMLLFEHLVSHGYIPSIMTMLHSCNHDRRLAAQSSFFAFCSSKLHLLALADAGAIEPLVEQLIWGSEAQRGWAAQALCRISMDKKQSGQCAQALNDRCVEGLVSCLHHSSIRHREAAVKALGSLASDDADLRFVASKGALVALVGLLDLEIYSSGDLWEDDEGSYVFSNDLSNCIVAVSLALRRLANSETNLELICHRTLLIPHLIKILGSRSVVLDGESDNQCAWNISEAAVNTLGSMAYCKTAKLSIVQRSGVIQKLKYLISAASDSCCEASLWLIGCLACETDLPSIFLKEGMVASLLEVLQSHERKRTSECLAAAAWCIRYLVGHGTSPANIDIAETLRPAVPTLLKLLTFQDKYTAKQTSQMEVKVAYAWALCSMSSDVTNSIHIVDYGAIWPLFRLLKECRECSNDGKDRQDNCFSSCEEAIACLLQNIGLYELRKAGLTLQHLRESTVNVSVLAVQQRLEGASALQLAKDGFTYNEIQDAGYSLISPLHRQSVQQGDSLFALAELLQSSACDNETFKVILQADLLGGIKNILHSSVVPHEVRCKAVEIIPLLVSRGISCPALLAHAGVLTPLLDMLSRHAADPPCWTLAARALASLSVASSVPTFGVADAGQQPKLQKRTSDDREISFHKVLIDSGVLLQLGRMISRADPDCRRVAIDALCTIVTKSAAEASVTQAMDSFVKSFFAEDETALEELLVFLKLPGNRPDSSSSTKQASQVLDMLLLLVSHSGVRKRLFDMTLMPTILHHLQLEVDKHRKFDAHKKSLQVEFSLSTSEKLIALLSHLSHDTENLLVLIESGGLEVVSSLLQIARASPSQVSHIRKADLIWIINACVPHAPAALFAVGCLEEVLITILDDIESLVLEAAIIVLISVMQVEERKYLSRIAALVNQLTPSQRCINASFSCSASSGSSLKGSRIHNRIGEISRGSYSTASKRAALRALEELTK